MAGGGGGAGEAIAAELTEFKIALTPASVSKAGIVTVHNGGSMVHNLYVTGTDLKGADLAAGASETLDLSGLAPGTYELYCNIAGHKESGMKTNLVIGAAAESGGATATTAPAAAGGGGMTAEEAAAMDKAMIASAKAFPAKTAGVGNQILEPTILADGTKHFELTAAITDWEVTPGKVVKAWTYNGMVPGPRINVAVGVVTGLRLGWVIPERRHALACRWNRHGRRADVLLRCALGQPASGAAAGSGDALLEQDRRHAGEERPRLQQPGVGAGGRVRTNARRIQRCRQGTERPHRRH